MTDLILELGSGRKSCCWHQDPCAEGPVGSPQHPQAAHTLHALGFSGTGRGAQPLQKRLWEQHRAGNSQPGGISHFIGAHGNIFCLMQEFSHLPAFHGARCVLHFPGTGEEAGNDSAGSGGVRRWRCLPRSQAGAEKAPEASQALIRAQGIKIHPFAGR